MKKILIPILVLSLLGCSNDSANENIVKTEDINYETKELTSSDVDNIEIGADLESVYKELGVPFKEWTSEFVYESLDDAIHRNEMTIALASDTNAKFTNALQDIVDNEKKAREINKLKMLQYTYAYDKNTEETALFWISPRTDTVVAQDKRSYIDENGENVDEQNEVDIDTRSSNETTEKSTEINDSLLYSIGESALFTSEDNGMLEIRIDSVSKFAGDDWDTPEGTFFAKVNFTVSNTGSTDIDINSHFFEFYDSDNIKSNRISKEYFSETIPPGKSAKGTVYFDVLSGGNTFEVFFADGVWSGEYTE